MSTLAISPPRAGRAVYVAGLVAVAVLSLGAPAARAEQTSAEFAEKYGAGVSAFKAHDMGKAYAAAKEAKAVAKTAFEKNAAANLMVNVAGASGKFADQAEALEQLVASDATPAASKGQLHKALAGAYAQTGKLDKALGEMKEAMRNGGSASDYDMLATLYFGSRDCKNGLEALDKALGGGKEASEQQLKAKDSCYFQMKDPRLLAVAEELLHRFPKKDWYNQVLSINQEKKIDDMAILEMLRYGFEHDYLDNESDYLKLADRALDVGTTAEAQRVLERGISKKVIKKLDKADGLLKQAKDRAAEDAKTVTQLDAEAHAGKNGDTDYRLGLRYFSMKQYDKAADALQRALSAERVARVKRPDDANMVLGMALLQVKKKADAEKAFTAAKGDARMAPAAKMWLGA